jgi:glycosyltransferase involved in cell wall biosynthesis
LPADFLLVNHVLLGAPVGKAVGMPFTVKAHGSELEFSLRGNPGLVEWARDSLAAAEEVVAGSEHIRGVLAEVVGWTAHVRIVPPGVDVGELQPESRGEALRSLLAEAGRDGLPRSQRDPDEGNAEQLSEEKGVAVLLEAVRDLDARTVVVGFGPAREELEREAGDRVLFTGALEHRHLRHLWPLADVSVTPSAFPEAFGMVAAEAAACGSPPLVARHSGLAEVARGLEDEYPHEYRELASFRRQDAADLRDKLRRILGLPHEDWEELSAAARRAAVRHWSWERVASLLVSRHG